MGYPKVLILDDQFGRCALGKQFRSAVGDTLFGGYAADRRALCANFGLIDITGDIRNRPAPEPVAEAIFSPAQTWNDADGRIENSLSTAINMVRKGWPFPDGSRWALVLVDLRFTFGKLNDFGDPTEQSTFGADILIPELSREFGPDLPIVVLSSTDRDENNTMTRRAGALDFIQRIPNVDDAPGSAISRLKEALYLHGLMPDDLGIVVGHDITILKMLRQARRGARSATTILLQGETGTGKGLVARYIHAISDRAEQPFETFNAAFRSADLQTDELFGHWKGAYTGANHDVGGVWERADGGTLFIDEVADLDQKVQQQLMPAIEEKRVRRQGHPQKGQKSVIPVDVRVILATNRPLEGLDSLKLDFINRVNAFKIEIPSLRERPNDVPELARRLAHQMAPDWSGEILPEAMEVLKSREWRQGNVRELRNVIERAIASNPGQVITEKDVGADYTGLGSSSRSNDTDLPGWQRFVDALREDPAQINKTNLSKLRDELSGEFPRLMALILAWALEATRNDKGMNFTAAARFLLGRQEIKTAEAKQIFRRILNIDARERSIAAYFRECEMSCDVDSLLGDLEDSTSPEGGR
ncbi:MAG: sigma-54-dependent Fis family transcriptional regulator [Magnetospirillum gryphiswaldense]|nr:sigma-54-dependent Fis family transcriptional regulator [Magnetospirillum gryphiswaldense]